MNFCGLVASRSSFAPVSVFLSPARSEQPRISGGLDPSSLCPMPPSHSSSSSAFSCANPGKSGDSWSLPAVAQSSQFSDEGAAALSFTEEYVTRRSADEVRKEILDCYALVNKLGRGAVYFGSSRTKTDHAHYLQAMELGREVALLLNCTSWTGVGPGMMDAVTQGALQVGKPVGGFKIYNEGGAWINSCVHPYLANHTYLTCRFFSARKHGLVEAGVRDDASERTAFICLPGGIGTLDEVFEILTLIQLDRIGSALPVPFLLLNYDGFYTDLLRFLTTCRDWGTVSAGEFEALCHVCASNADALEYLADFYGVGERERLFRPRLREFKTAAEGA